VDSNEIKQDTRKEKKKKKKRQTRGGEIDKQNENGKLVPLVMLPVKAETSSKTTKKSLLQSMPIIFSPTPPSIKNDATTGKGGGRGGSCRLKKIDPISFTNVGL